MADNSYFWKQLSKSKPQPRLNEVYEFVKIKQVFKEIKSFCLEEELDFVAEKVGVTSMLKQQLATAFPGFEVKTKNQAFRLQPLDTTNKPPISEEIVKNAIEKLGYEYVAKHAPKGYFGAQSKSRSGTFDTYEFNAMGAPFFMVFGVGANKGNEYEKKVNEEMKLLKGEHAILKLLLPMIRPDTIADVDGRKGKTGRPFTGLIENVGSIIGDTVVTGDSGKIYYLSLKNPDGQTISNHGCAKMFTSWDNDNNLKFNEKVCPPITKLLNDVGVDMNLMLGNLQQYINRVLGRPWQLAPDARVEITNGLDSLKSAILSSIGYGYYYARQKADGSIQFEDFSTPELVKEFVGKVIKGELKYPYVNRTDAPAEDGKDSRSQKRKGLDIVGYTDKGWRFTFQIRNASSGLVPRQMNLMIAGNGTKPPPKEEGQATGE
jgi:hypothetical protein